VADLVNPDPSQDVEQVGLRALFLAEPLEDMANAPFDADFALGVELAAASVLSLSLISS
jgi:hypothetical protein